MGSHQPRHRALKPLLRRRVAPGWTWSNLAAIGAQYDSFYQWWYHTDFEIPTGHLRETPSQPARTRAKVLGSAPAPAHPLGLLRSDPEPRRNVSAPIHGTRAPGPKAGTFPHRRGDQPPMTLPDGNRAGLFGRGNSGRRNAPRVRSAHYRGRRFSAGTPLSRPQEEESVRPGRIVALIFGIVILLWRSRWWQAAGADLGLCHPAGCDGFITSPDYGSKPPGTPWLPGRSTSRPNRSTGGPRTCWMSASWPSAPTPKRCSWVSALHRRPMPTWPASITTRSQSRPTHRHRLRAARGGAPAEPPAAQDFWVVSAEGPVSNR